MQKEIAHIHVVAVLSKFVDRVTAMEQHARITIYVGNI